MKTSLAAVLIGLALGSPWSAAMAATDNPQQFLEAQSLFEHGLRGWERESERAMKKFRALSEQEPDNPLYMKCVQDRQKLPKNQRGNFRYRTVSCRLH